MEFDIRDVVAMHGLTVRKGHGAEEMICDCPFCNAKAKFFVTHYKDSELKNKFHCYVCGKGGGVVTLHAYLSGTSDYKAASRELYEHYNYIGNGGTKCTPRLRQNKMKEKPKEDPKRCDRAYRELLRILTLSPEHLAHLTGRKRGLTEKQTGIFKSVCIKNPEEIALKLIKRGIEICGVPGFYKNRYGRWSINFWEGNQGILIPCPDTNGRIVGMQILLDNPKNGMKYSWLTSVNRYGGIAAKACIAVYRGNENQDVIVCEGCLKAYIVHCITGYTVIGITGINNTKELPNALQTLKKEGMKRIFLATDMDCFMSCICDCNDEKCNVCDIKNLAYKKYDCPYKVRKKKGLIKSREKIISMIKETGLVYRSLYWDYVENKDKEIIWCGKIKGPDDYLLTRGISFDAMKTEMMKDKKFRTEYEKLQPRYEAAEQIILARKELNITQSELARRVGTQRSNISRLESGTCNPSIDLLTKIADALGKSLVVRLK